MLQMSHFGVCFQRVLWISKMFWFRTNNIKSEFLSIFISDTPLRSSQGILQLDIIKNWLLTNIILYDFSSWMGCESKINAFNREKDSFPLLIKSGVNQMSELGRTWALTCQDSGSAAPVSRSSEYYQVKKHLNRATKLEAYIFN